MNSQLIVHQPYRSLTSLQTDLALSQDDVALAWSVVNDHYMTDLPILYPPHVIALTAVLLCLVLRPAATGGQGNGGGSGTTIANMSVAAATAALAQAQARAAIQGGGNGGGVPSASAAAASSAQTAAQQGQGDGAARDKAQETRTKVQRFAAWLAESNVDIDGMVDCTQELIAFYECHEQYNDKIAREQINRFIKARGLDK